MVRKHQKTGFTLVELLLVLVILGTLAAIVVPKFAGRSEQAKIAAAEAQITNFETALDAFEIDNSYYPSTEDGLQPLVEAPDDADNWRGPYLKKGVPLDRWGNEFIYRYPSEMNDTGYDLICLGPDGREDTEDDITNWDED